MLQPLHVASFTGNISVVTSLLSSGADRNALDDNNVSPLHWAAQCGHSSIVDVLLLGGAYPNFLDHSAGRGTPLDYALEAGHHDCANLLRQANGFTSKEIITVFYWPLNFGTETNEAKSCVHNNFYF